MTNHKTLSKPFLSKKILVMKVASEFEKVVSEKLAEVYDQAIDHAIKTVKSYHTYIQSPVVDLVLEKIIQDLEKLKK